MATISKLTKFPKIVCYGKNIHITYMAARKKQAEKLNKLSVTNKADSVDTTSCDEEG